MKVYFISDDSFFLLGVEAVIARKIDCPVEFVDVKKAMTYINPSPDDILVVAIDNIDRRGEIMSFSFIKNCRVMLLINIKLNQTTRRTYPWIIKKGISPSELALIIDKAKKSEKHFESVSRKCKQVVYSLCKGSHISEVSQHFKLSSKNIYQMKRTLLIKFGISQCNSTSVLICRDILQGTSIHD